jgi:hypothetical protein
MPSSNAENIPLVLHFAWRLAPQSVLDCGAGFGKYGVLFREYLELQAANGAGRTDTTLDLPKRQVRIDAVEGFGAYINGVHRAVYDNVFVETIEEFVKKDWSYDFIYLGDVLEHLEKDEAQQSILPSLISRARFGVLIVVPFEVEAQEAVFGNQLEIHRSRWTKQDFVPLAPYSFVGRRGAHLFAFLTRQAECVKKVKPNAIRRRLSAMKWAMLNSV